MTGTDGDEHTLSEIIWIAEADFKEASLILHHDWKFKGEQTYAEAEDLEIEDIDYDDDEYYAIVEYYEGKDGSTAEIYYLDEAKTQISDIRFWMKIDEEEKDRFIAQYKELHPDWKPDSDDVLFDPGPYYSFLYAKALGKL